MSSLRIGIDGRAFSSPAAGVRRYTTELAEALLALPDAPDLVALGGAPSALPRGLAHVEAGWSPPTNLGWLALGLPRAAARARVDVLHAPAYTAPPLSPAPVVLTIHDVSYERHPEWYPYHRDVARRALYRHSARSAAHVLTDSRFSRDEIVAAYGLPPDRVTVAPLGVSPALTGDGGSADPLPVGVRGPFLLHVGDLHARRNLALVVGALAEACKAHPGLDLSLVLAGVDRGVGEALDAQAAAAGMRSLVRLGAVDDRMLRALYGSALALVYPSRYEGFGLPVVEAMANGTPVLAARAASMPEVLGDAGLLIDPDDEAGWADAIARLAADAALGERLRAAGRERARSFTWARTAAATLEVYRRVAGVREGDGD